MNITNATQTSGFPPVSRSTQDSHEQEIQKQILSLQEKMRDVAYNNEMSSEEKDSRKKELQEQIQSLNSELKQYQLRKRQEEAERRQEEAARKREEESERNVEASKTGTEAEETEVTEAFPEANASGSIFSNSNRKEHLASLHKVRNDLEGKLRTASTEEEKNKLQKRLLNVSRAMGVKIQDITDTIADSHRDGQSGKTRNGRTAGEPKNDSSMPGRVIITRIKD